jgi:hypothetical protein
MSILNKAVLIGAAFMTAAAAGYVTWEDEVDTYVEDTRAEWEQEKQEEEKRAAQKALEKQILADQEAFDIKVTGVIESAARECSTYIANGSGSGACPKTLPEVSHQGVERSFITGPFTVTVDRKAHDGDQTTSYAQNPDGSISAIACGIANIQIKNEENGQVRTFKYRNC